MYELDITMDDFAIKMITVTFTDPFDAQHLLGRPSFLVRLRVNLLHRLERLYQLRELLPPPKPYVHSLPYEDD